MVGKHGQAGEHGQAGREVCVQTLVGKQACRHGMKQCHSIKSLSRLGVAPACVLVGLLAPSHDVTAASRAASTVQLCVHSIRPDCTKARSTAQTIVWASAPATHEVVRVATDSPYLSCFPSWCGACLQSLSFDGTLPIRLAKVKLHYGSPRTESTNRLTLLLLLLLLQCKRFSCSRKCNASTVIAAPVWATAWKCNDGKNGVGRTVMCIALWRVNRREERSTSTRSERESLRHEKQDAWKSLERVSARLATNTLTRRDQKRSLWMNEPTKQRCASRRVSCLKHNVVCRREILHHQQSNAVGKQIDRSESLRRV